MTDIKRAVQTMLRIPGRWTHPRELLGHVPDGFRLTEKSLVLLAVPR